MKHITTTDAGVQRSAALEMLRAWYLNSPRAGALALARPPMIAWHSSSCRCQPPTGSQTSSIQIDVPRSAATQICVLHADIRVQH